MIASFRSKALERYFLKGDESGLTAQHVRRIRIILTALNTASDPSGMNLPGLQLHPLKGQRKGQWAVSVSGNWRVVFRFDGQNACDVDLEDYH